MEEKIEGDEIAEEIEQTDNNQIDEEIEEGADGEETEPSAYEIQESYENNHPTTDDLDEMYDGEAAALHQQPAETMDANIAQNESTLEQHHTHDTSTQLEDGGAGAGAASDDLQQQQQPEHEEEREEEHQHSPHQQQAEVVSVELPASEGLPARVVLVQVENHCVKKPFLGGYRHKQTKVEYHHATTQTDNPKKKRDGGGRGGGGGGDDDAIVRFHRQTQTYKVSSRMQQTYREQGTQMAKPGLHIDDSNDREVEPDGEYFDSEKLAALRLEKTVIIQSHYRGWRARRLAAQMRSDKESQEQQESEMEEKKKRKEMEMKRREINRRMHPKSAADFDMLYQNIEQWRLEETRKIKESSQSEEEKKAGLIELLRKETKLLQTLDRLKISATADNKYENVNTKLDKMSKAKVLKHEDGTTINMETPFTIRARELMDLYHGLNTEMLSVDERLDVLLHVKWTVKEFDCQLTRDLVELIDREADLLNRGRKDASLVGLRRRIANLFLQFVETPEFNPEATKYQRIPIEFAIRPHIKPPPEKRKLKALPSNNNYNS